MLAVNVPTGSGWWQVFFGNSMLIALVNIGTTLSEFTVNASRGCPRCEYTSFTARRVLPCLLQAPREGFGRDSNEITGGCNASASGSNRSCSHLRRAHFGARSGCRRSGTPNLWENVELFVPVFVFDESCLRCNISFATDVVNRLSTVWV